MTSQRLCAFCGEYYQCRNKSLSKKTLDLCFSATLQERCQVMLYINRSVASDEEILNYIMNEVFVGRRTHSFRVLLKAIKRPLLLRIIRGDDFLHDAIAHYKRHRSWSIFTKLETDPERRNLSASMRDHIFQENSSMGWELSPVLCARRIHLARVIQLLQDITCEDVAFVIYQYIRNTI